jgi:hypothetical protein
LKTFEVLVFDRIVAAKWSILGHHKETAKKLAITESISKSQFSGSKSYTKKCSANKTAEKAERNSTDIKSRYFIENITRLPNRNCSDYDEFYKY